MKAAHKQRIVLCAYDSDGACGGPYRWVVEFSRFLKSAGWELLVLAFCPGGREVSEITIQAEASGIPVRTLDLNDAPYIEQQVEWTLRRSAEWRPSVFVANLVLPACYAGRWLHQSGVKTVGVLHSNPHHDPFYKEMLRCFVHGRDEWRFDAVVCVSDFLARLAREGADPEHPRIETISCGTFLPTVTAEPPADTLRLLYLGRIVQEQKRIRELTESFLAAAATGSIEATICGGGPESAWVEERLGGQDRVRFLGVVKPDDTLELMKSHHAIVLLSDYEGLPMALMEGMACGLVPICLDEPSGTRELVSDGSNGLIVNNREGEFLDAVNRLRAPGYWPPLSRNARETVKSDYTYPVVFGKWANLIEELAEAAAVRKERIPESIALEVHRTSFRHFQISRPTWWENLRNSFRETILQLRLRIRPRARLRAIFRPSNSRS